VIERRVTAVIYISRTSSTRSRIGLRRGVRFDAVLWALCCWGWSALSLVCVNSSCRFVLDIAAAPRLGWKLRACLAGGPPRRLTCRVCRIVRSPPSSVLHAREPSASLSECGSTLVKPTHVRCYCINTCADACTVIVSADSILICRRADSRASPGHMPHLNARRARPREKDIVEKGPALLEKSKSLSDLVSPPLRSPSCNTCGSGPRPAAVCAAPVSTFEFGLRGRPSVHRRFRRPDRTPLKNRPTGPGRLRGERGGRKQDTLTNSHSQGTRWIHLGAFPR